SSWRAEESLGDYLARHGIPGIEGIDTRALVRHLRDHGAQEAVLSSVDLDAERLVRGAVSVDAGSMDARRIYVRGRLRRTAREAAARGRRLRLRHQAEHPAK